VCSGCSTVKSTVPILTREKAIQYAVSGINSKTDV
jgi:hypothetical protein